MDHALYLIASGADDALILERFRALLESGATPSALLVPQGGRDSSAYARLVLALIALAQPRGCAVLLDNLVDRVAELRADGVHITGGIKALREAVDALKPDFIVGAGDIGSRHEAMLRGEFDIDYLMFGDRDDGEEGAAMAAWWAETFEVPAVYVAQAPADPVVPTVGTEFIAYLTDDWAALRQPASQDTP